MTDKSSETTVATDGIKTQLDLMTKVFAATVGLAIGGYVYLVNKVDGITTNIADIRVSASAQTEQLKAISGKLSEVVTGVQAIPAKLPAPISPGGAGDILMRFDNGKPFIALDYTASISLYGLAPNTVLRALKAASPPPRAGFALTSNNGDLLHEFKDAIGGDVADSRLQFGASQIYALPEAIAKTNPHPADDLQLVSTDGDYMKLLQTKLRQQPSP